MKVAVIPTQGEPHVRMIKDTASWEDWVKIIGCEYIDIATRRVGDKYFDFIVDDIGALVDDPIATVFEKDGTPLLFGTCIICNHDDDGNTVGLTTADLELLGRNTAEWSRDDGLHGYGIIASY